jgi:hypothetical protein
LAHFRSTPNAIAKGRNRSNISGVFTSRSSRSPSTRRRNSSNPSTRSSARAPSTVRAGMMRPNAATISPLMTAAIANGSGVMSSHAAPMVEPMAKMAPPTRIAPNSQ